MTPILVFSFSLAIIKYLLSATNNGSANKIIYCHYSIDFFIKTIMLTNYKKMFNTNNNEKTNQGLLKIIRIFIRSL